MQLANCLRRVAFAVIHLPNGKFMIIVNMFESCPQEKSLETVPKQAGLAGFLYVPKGHNILYI